MDRIGQAVFVNVYFPVRPTSLANFEATTSWVNVVRTPMRQCWICNQTFDRLSKEHIIPSMFGGYVTTEGFSCAECNGKLGKSEASLSPVSILMQNLDNANGEPTNILPQGESPKKDRKWNYGRESGIELTASGGVRGSVWERAPGKVTSDDKVYIPGRIEINLPAQDVHKSMLKALMSLACHEDFPHDLLDVPLGYLGGNDDVLPLMQPTGLGIPPQSVFARVWIFSPPTASHSTIYGAVAYGPLANIYQLRNRVSPAWPFCVELRAYSKEVLVHGGLANYMNWRSSLREEAVPPSEYNYIGRSGPFGIRENRRSGLLVAETSPSRAISMRKVFSEVDSLNLPFERVYSANDRFENWVASARSEEDHSQFLASAMKFDEQFLAIDRGQMPLAGS